METCNAARMHIVCTSFAASPNLSINHLLPRLVFQATTKSIWHHHSCLWPAPKPLHPGVRDEVPRPVRVLKVAVLVGQSRRCTARTKGPLGERLLTLWGAHPPAERVGTRTLRPPLRFAGTTNPSPVLYSVSMFHSSWWCRRHRSTGRGVFAVTSIAGFRFWEGERRCSGSEQSTLFMYIFLA